MTSLQSIIRGTLPAFIILFSTAFTSVDTGMEATEWEIDKAHSKISFEVRHFFTPVSGQFTDYSSVINFDPDDLAESSVNIEIMVNSIDTDNEKRDGHLQSPDFFNAEKYPTITFRSDEIVKENGNNYVARGQLTIKEVTKDVELPFTLLGVQDHPMREGVQLAGIKLTHTLDRNAYNVGTGDWVETSVVGGDVNITATLELNSTQNASTN